MAKKKEKGEAENQITMKYKPYKWSRRTLKELIVLQHRIMEILRKNGIWAYTNGAYERKDEVIKVMLDVYPLEILKEKGMLDKLMEKGKQEENE